MLKRRLWFFVIPLAVVLFAMVTLAYSLPAVYRSTGTILIEQQGLPTDLVRTTVSSFAEERIALIRQRAMTATNQLEIMERHNLYPELRQGGDTTAAVARFRNAIRLETETADVIDPRSGRPTSATISFTISFDSSSPDVAQAVATELVELFLAENQRERQEVTREASQFLNDESMRLAEEISELEERLAAFKTESGSSLPEMLQPNLDAIQRLNERLRDIDKSINSLTESSILLEGELARTDPFVVTGTIGLGGERILAPADQLRLLESQSIALSSRYSPEHPDRRKVEQELSALRSAINSGSLQSQARDPDNPAYIQIRSRLIANSTELTALKRSRDDMENQLKVLEQRVAMTPEVEQRYRVLTRDYQSALDRYRDVRGKLMEARMAESLETESKGERFTLIEPPRLPDVPVKPNRPALMFLGTVLGIGSGLGSVVLRQSVDRGIYSARVLIGLTGHAPLALIPMIRTKDDDLEWQRSLIRMILLLISIILMASLIIITSLKLDIF